MTVIAIDGPAGSGKSTVARKLATQLGFVHLNSGALFRAVAVLAMERGLSLQDEAQLADLARKADFRFVPDLSGITQARGTSFLVNNQEFRDRIGLEETGRFASQIAVYPMLREVLADVQRKAAEQHSLVVEGRDAGTVVFPKADFKFYLDATPEVRAQRRFAQVQYTQSQSLDEIRREMEIRDLRDSTRAVAPQVRAADAILVDTSGLSADDVVTKIAAIIKQAISVK